MGGAVAAGLRGGYAGRDIDRTLLLEAAAWAVVAVALVVFDRAAWRESPAPQPAATALTTAVIHR